MEKEQVKCELCEYIKAANAKAEEERIKFKEIYDATEETNEKVLKQVMRNIDLINCNFVEKFDGYSVFMLAYRVCFDDARFTFADLNFNSDNSDVISNYIQYCPCCGRKIKQ